MWLTILNFAKGYWKEILFPLLIVAIIGSIYFYGKAEGKMEYKAKCTARMEALRAASQKAQDELQVKVDDAAKAYEDLKTSSAAKQADINKRYEDAIKQKTIVSCPATPSFVQLYREATGYSTGAESKPIR